MMTDKQSHLHDAPLQSAAADCLHRAQVARAIHRVIKSAPHEWSARIAITGPWGSGKTSVLNFIRELEERDGAQVVYVPAWAAKDDQQLMKLLVDQIFRALDVHGGGKPVRPWAKRIADRWSGAISRVFSFGSEKAADIAWPGSGMFAKSTVEAVMEKAAGWTAIKRDDVEAAIGQLVLRGVNRLVVFVDDLDRADPKALPRALLALREILDWPNLTFVLAFDQAVVTQALAEYTTAYGDRAERFLEKIVDVTFELTDLSDQTEHFARKLLDEACAFIPELERQAAARWMPPNPRQAKAVARTLSALKDVALRHYPGELNWTAITMQLSLRQCARSVAIDVERELPENRLSEAAIRREPAQPMDEVTELLTRHFGEVQSPLRKFLYSLISALVQQRRDTPPDRMKSEMALLSREPAFTLRELHLIVEAMPSSDQGAFLERELTEGVRRSETNEDDAAIQLVLGLLAYFDTRFSAALTTRGEAQQAQLMVEASAVLTALEAVVARSMEGPIARAVQSFQCGLRVLAIAKQMVVVPLNGVSHNLASRYAELLEAFMERCTDPLRLYDSVVQPFDSGFGQRQTGEWIRGLHRNARETLEARVAMDVVNWFRTPAGLQLGDVHREPTVPIRKWILECPDSPIYRQPELQGLLIRGLEEVAAVADPNGIVALNAELYLVVLISPTHGSFMPNDQREFLGTILTLIELAWRITCTLRRQPVGQMELLRIRGALLALDIPQQRLPLRGWIDESVVSRTEAALPH